MYKICLRGSMSPDPPTGSEVHPPPSHKILWETLCVCKMSDCDDTSCLPSGSHSHCHCLAKVIKMTVSHLCVFMGCWQGSKTPCSVLPWLDACPTFDHPNQNASDTPRLPAMISKSGKMQSQVHIIDCNIFIQPTALYKNM